MSCWFTGQKPQAAFRLRANFNSHFGDADDYSTITVRFPEAVALLEGSWTTVNSGGVNGPILFGLEGTIVVQLDGKVEIYKKRRSQVPDRIVEPEPLPAGRENLARETLHYLDTGEALFPMLDLPLNMSAVSILDAGARSAKSGKMEPANDYFWCAGA